MKRSLFILAVLVFSIPAFAQRGTWLWYGNLGGNNASTDAPIVNGVKWQIHTVEGIGYQFARHWHGGLQGSVGYAHSEVYNGSGAIDNVKNSDWSVGLFFRYTVGKRLYAFVQYDMGWAQSKQKVNDIEVGHAHGLGIGLTPTVGVDVWHGWCLNLSFANISWNSTTPTNAAGTSVNSTDFVYNIGQTFNFGISKIIGVRHAAACAKAREDKKMMSPAMPTKQ